MAPAGRIARGRVVSRHPVAGEYGQEVAQKVNVSTQSELPPMPLSPPPSLIRSSIFLHFSSISSCSFSLGLS